MILLGKYEFGLASFEFSDDLLAERFGRVYDLSFAPGSRQADVRFEIRNSDAQMRVRANGGGFDVLCNGDSLVLGESLPKALGVVDFRLEELIRSVASQSRFSFHAASVLLSEGAVCCMGVSGSGKTSLALALAGVGARFLGDEYAFYFPEDNTIFHEAHPVQLKEHRAEQLGIDADLLDGILMESPYGVRTVAFEPRSVDVVCASGSHPLSVILLPRFVLGMGCKVDKVNARMLPQAIMPSVLGGADRALAAKMLMHALARNNVHVRAVTYGDAEEAAKAIVRSIVATSCVKKSVVD